MKSFIIIVIIWAHLQQKKSCKYIQLGKFSKIVFYQINSKFKFMEKCEYIHIIFLWCNWALRRINEYCVQHHELVIIKKTNFQFL